MYLGDMESASSKLEVHFASTGTAGFRQFSIGTGVGPWLAEAIAEKIKMAVTSENKFDPCKNIFFIVYAIRKMAGSVTGLCVNA